MSSGTVPSRMAEILNNASEGPNYWSRLLDVCGGDADAAARLDLAYDGELHHLDLRRKPFARDPKMKEAAKATRDARTAFNDLLLNRVWMGSENVDGNQDV